MDAVNTPAEFAVRSFPRS